ncbi:hypothetical protein Gohar_024606, partial [Gossypium harknessii]|nr:hypothetical protein [Gossypium harknessii]
SGGVLRDENGDWIAGDNCYFGNCSIFNAKFWSNLEGLKLSQRRGHDNIIIQSDSLEWILHYILREQNQVVAKLVLVKKEELETFDLPPTVILGLLEIDKSKGQNSMSSIAVSLRQVLRSPWFMSSLQIAIELTFLGLLPTA